jgi:hypothetical protein
MGSGTVGRVCDKLGRSFVGYDLMKEFHKLKKINFKKINLNLKVILFLLVIYGCNKDSSPTLFNLEVLTSNGGVVSLDSGEFEIGTKIVLTATPDEGYRFVGWEGFDSNNETITVQINSNLIVRALFERIPVYSFTLQVWRGKVEVNGIIIQEDRPTYNSGRFISGSYTEGSDIEIIVTPNEGYFFSNWNGINSDERTLKITGSSNLNLEAIVLPIVCPDNDCWVKLYTDFEKDSNGFHHVTPQWTSENSGRFNLHIDSSPTTSVCQYNGVSVVSSIFDSDSYWEVESGLSFTFGLYNPFQSMNTQQGNIIKVRDTTVNLNYFQGTIIPIVQESSISHDVKDKMECYGWDNPNSGPTPTETGNCILYSKRIVGPLIREMIGDTITIYSETNFDCGTPSKIMRDSIKLIIH